MMSAPAPPPRKHRQTPEGGSASSREYYPAIERGSSGIGVPKKVSGDNAGDLMETPRTGGKGELPVKTDAILNEMPDAVVGVDVGINGELEFEKMVRVEGTFEGKLLTKVRIWNLIIINLNLFSLPFW